MGKNKGIGVYADFDGKFLQDKMGIDIGNIDHLIGINTENWPFPWPIKVGDFLVSDFFSVPEGGPTKDLYLVPRLFLYLMRRAKVLNIEYWPDLHEPGNEASVTIYVEPEMINYSLTNDDFIKLKIACKEAIETQKIQMQRLNKKFDNLKTTNGKKENNYRS